MGEDKEIIKSDSLMPADLIVKAIEGRADLDKLERLLGLQREWEANEARKAYNKAMVEVHRNIPIVTKTLKNVQTNSTYASLDDTICTAKEVYTKEGFSISFYEGETAKENHIRICADVIHEEGHKETYHYDVPLDGKGIKGNVNMTPIHAKASSTSYGRRYLMDMIWNIPTGDDDDGQKASEASMEYITSQQVMIINNRLVETNSDKEMFYGYMEIDKVEHMLTKDFNKAMAALRAKEKQVSNDNNK